MAKRRLLPWGQGFITERNGRHQARWQDGGTWRAKTFASEDEAVEFLQTVARSKRRGTYAPPSTMTVADVLNEFFNRPSQRISDNTLHTYRTRARTMILPYLGDKRVTELRTIDVQRWLDDRTRAGYAASTIQPALAVLSAAIKEAKALGLIDHNPTEGVRRPSIPRTSMQTWTEEEARRVLRVVEGDEIFNALYHVALATGMRPGELRALKWLQIDFERAVIRVNATITNDQDGREITASKTKTGSGRAVAIGEPLRDVLKWHRARQAERRLIATAWEDIGVVFDRGNGHWLNQSSWRGEHIRICEAAGVPIIRLHDLRHTAASLLVAKGANIKIVSEILGHSTVTFTLDTYVHIPHDMQRQTIELLADMFTPMKEDETIESATTWEQTGSTT